MRPTALRTRALFPLFVAIVTGCSSGGGSVAPVPGTSASPQAPSSKEASVAFTMHWAASAQLSVRRRTYVPATARSVTVSVNGGQPQYLNNPSMNLTIAAPSGVDNFAFTTYDEQNGEGNALSAAILTQTVLTGQTNFVSATLNGIVTSLGISLANASLPAGAAATTAVNVSALDADGNVIVGPGDYDTPIHLAISDPSNSGTVSLSTNLLQAPPSSGSVTLSYTGGTLASGLAGAPLTTVVASATGLTSATVAFTPKPTFYYVTQVSDSITHRGGYPAGITAGPDGNMWVTDSYNDAIDRITPAGTITSFPLGNSGFEPSGIITASDGNLWFTEQAESGSASGHIGRLTPAGTLTEANTVGKSPTALIDGGDGYIYYVDEGLGLGEQSLDASSATLIEAKDSSAGVIASAIALGNDHAVYYTSNFQVGKAPLQNFGNAPAELVFPAETGGEIGGLTRGPDGNIWVTDQHESTVDMVSTKSFTITSSYATVNQSNPRAIVAGQDGALWFNNGDNLSRVTIGGTITDFPNPFEAQAELAVAPDGSLWFAQPNSPLIAKLVY